MFSKSESQSNMERLLSIDTRIETDVCESSQEDETFDSCSWDHDYVADKLVCCLVDLILAQI